MPSTRCWSARALLGGAALCVSGLASAEPTPRQLDASSPVTENLDAAPDSEPGLIARAKALFARGAAAYGSGRYYEAIESFSEANRLYPNPQFSFNIAKAYDNLGSHSGALRYYLEYLRRSPDAPDRVAIESRARELELAIAERGVQQLTVLTEPSEAMVYLDGKPVGLTPWTGETWPGKHTLALRREHYAAHEVAVELERFRASELNVKLERARPPAKAPVIDERVRWEETHHTSALTWICFGTAAAALGTAVVIEASAGNDSRKLEPATAFFAGLGAASATFGGVLLYFDLSTDDAPSSQPTAAAFGLGMAAGGGFAGYRAAF